MVEGLSVVAESVVAGTAAGVMVAGGMAVEETAEGLVTLGEVV